MGKLVRVKKKNPARVLIYNRTGIYDRLVEVFFFFFPAGCFVNRHVIYVSFGIETWVLFAPRSSYPVE